MAVDSTFVSIICTKASRLSTQSPICYAVVMMICSQILNHYLRICLFQTFWPRLRSEPPKFEAALFKDWSDPLFFLLPLATSIYLVWSCDNRRKITLTEARRLTELRDEQCEAHSDVGDTTQFSTFPNYCLDFSA